MNLKNKMAIIQLLVTCTLLAYSVNAEPVRPLFPGDYSVHQSTFAIGAGNFDKVSGPAYWSNSTGRVAYLDNDGKKNVQYHFSNSSELGQHAVFYYNDKICQYFCDLRGSGTDSQCDLGDALCQYDYIHKSKFGGNGTVRGLPVYKYTYKENIIIVKADHEIDVLQKDNQTPVRQQHVLKPFGKEIIVEINMTDYSTAPIDPSVWIIPDQQYCQEGTDAQCGDQSLHHNIMAKRRSAEL
eukprot:m.339091 g.339091  ORF g.339091 m.339091 type:complete len:239 (-) comp18657_c0_seq1:57-773(-)